MRNSASIRHLVLLVVVLLAAEHAASAQAQSSVRHSEVSGTVVSKVDGHLLDRARVVLRDVSNPQQFESQITGHDGKFAFHNVHAGKYSLAGAKRGFISAAYDQHDEFSTAIVTGAALPTENLVLKLAPAGLISGNVLDEAGDPVRHATVTLYRNDHEEGVDQIRQSQSAQTDDLGAYEIPSLMPGTYFLSANAAPWYAIHRTSENQRQEDESSSNFDRSLDAAYPITYYADVTDPESATPIPIRGGERLQVDIHLNPVPSLRLLFHLPKDPDGRKGVAFPQFEQPGFEDASPIPTNVGAYSPPDGLLEVTGIPAGHYNIQFLGQGTNLEMNGVDITRSGEEIDATGAEPMAKLKVSVQIPGAASLPPGLAIGLRGKRRMLAGSRPLDDKGETEIEQLPAGTYEVMVFGRQTGYSIAHLSAEGAELDGHKVTVASGASASLSLSLGMGSVGVQGTAKRAGKPFAGAMVVLVPQNPEGNRDLFRRDQSDLDGTFTLRNVIPGSYTLLAIQDGWDLDWSQPGVISAYLKHGRAIQVGNSPGKPLHVTEAIEVVSK
jgi:Carboxypeptidase regulatory-like domain